LGNADSCEPQENILIDESGKARLCDFGLASFTATVEMSTSAGGTRGTTSWMAPELYDLEDDESDHKHSKPTEASDIYAMSMVIVEVRCIILEAGWSLLLSCRFSQESPHSTNFGKKP
jgi:serine/threonine protein kinase